MLEFTPFAGRFIRERIWHASQKLRELKGGGVRLELALSSFVEVKRFALAWGAECRVVAPKAPVLEVGKEIRTQR